MAEHPAQVSKERGVNWKQIKDVVWNRARTAKNRSDGCPTFKDRARTHFANHLANKTEPTKEECQDFLDQEEKTMPWHFVKVIIRSKKTAEKVADRTGQADTDRTGQKTKGKRTRSSSNPVRVNKKKKK